MVGTELMEVLDRHRESYLATWHTRPIKASQENEKRQTLQLDLTDHTAVLRVMEAHNRKITKCVYLAAIKSVDQCEADWAHTKKVNIDAPAHMASLCHDFGIRFIFLSSDYVFNGRDPPYVPDSTPCPLQNYGMSKLLAELQVQAIAPLHVIVRTPTLYGPNHKLHESSITSPLKALMNFTDTEGKRVDDGNVRRPVYLPDLAVFLYDVLCDNTVRQTVHFGNTQWALTKYEMVEACAEYLGLPSCRLERDSSEPSIPRPEDTLLHPKVSGQARFADTFPDLLDRHKLTIDKDTLVLLDLDGTLIDSHGAHRDAYAYYLPETVDRQLLLQHVQSGTIDQFLASEYFSDRGIHFKPEDIQRLKEKKRKHLRKEPVEFMPGAEELLEYLNEHRITYCVVTNTNWDTVRIFQEKLPLLNSVFDWITREDYNNPKPNPECYELALRRFCTYKHKRVIGIEDSVAGMQALTSAEHWLSVAPVLFGEMTGMRNHIFQTTDCYWFDDYTTLLDQST